VKHQLQKNHKTPHCPLEGIIDIIGRKWALLIINAIGNSEKARFNELMTQLKIVSPKTLADTLKQLQQENLIKRDAYPEIPPRVEYSLTKDGEELWQAILPILKWTSSRGDSQGRKCSSTNCKLKNSQKELKK